MRRRRERVTLTFAAWTPRLGRTHWRVHGGNVENAQPGWCSNLVRWLRARVVGERRGGDLWLGIALRGNVSRVLGLCGVGIWPELRVVMRVRGWVRLTTVRMIGVVCLQKVVGVHEGRAEGGAELTKQG